MLETTPHHNRAPSLNAASLLSEGVPCIYVHLTSGEIEELRPADSLSVGPEGILVFNGGQQIAQFSACDVLFCSHLDVSPFPCS